MLKIASSDYDALRHYGEESYPHECCGILLGKVEGDSRIVHAVIRCTNTHKDAPQTHYEIDPRELIRAQRNARERDLEVIGFYHSHPDHPALCSSTDLEEAHWIGCSYVITAVENGKATQTNSFLLTGTREEDKSFEQEQLIVDEVRLIS